MQNTILRSKMTNFEAQKGKINKKLVFKKIYIFVSPIFLFLSKPLKVFKGWTDRKRSEAEDPLRAEAAACLGPAPRLAHNRSLATWRHAAARRDCLKKYI